MADGDRIENLARLFNIREGKGTRKYDDVPYKIKNFPVPDEGPAKGVCVNDEEMAVGLDDYYASRGWTMKAAKEAKPVAPEPPVGGN